MFFHALILYQHFLEELVPLQNLDLDFYLLNTQPHFQDQNTQPGSDLEMHLEMKKKICSMNILTLEGLQNLYKM